ncbi:MAG: MSMEG_0565 family glycosyltransferase [Cyanobacteria bacterium J06607_13]
MIPSGGVAAAQRRSGWVRPYATSQKQPLFCPPFFSPMLRIALLTYSTKPRGSVIHTLELANALHQLGHSPTVFALDKDSTQENSGFPRPTPFKTIPIPAQPCNDGIEQLIYQRIQEFVAFFQQHTETYDIYHAQDCLSANALAALRTAGHIPHFIRTVHHIENFNSPYLQACQEKSIYQPDRCLCVSQLWQNALQQDYGIAAHRVTNGVSDRFSPHPDHTDRLLAKKLNSLSHPLYLTVGGIEPRKNSLNLLRALAKVKQHQPTAQLLIAGGATLFDYQDYRQQFFTLARSYALQDSLLLPGVIDDPDMPALYRLADAFVFPSIKEGWGLVVMEAIASHLPVLTSNHPPFTEFLTPEMAVLIDPSNVQEIATGMLKLTSGKHLSKVQQSQTAPSVYPPSLAVQSWKTSAVQHLQLYRQLI